MRALIATLTAFKLFAATPVLAEGLIDAIKAQNAVDPQKAFQFFLVTCQTGRCGRTGHARYHVCRRPGRGLELSKRLYVAMYCSRTVLRVR